MARILIVDDEKELLFTLGCLLKEEGYDVDTTDSRDEALKMLQQWDYDLAFVDIMLGRANGIDLLRDIRACNSNVQVVMITGRPDVDTAAETVRFGAFDYVIKPIRQETLTSVTRHALKNKQLVDEKERYRANLDAIFRSVNDAIFMVDRDMRLIQFNAAATNFCGYREQMLNNTVMEIDSGCAGMCLNVLAETVKSGKTGLLKRFECCLQDGTVRVINFTSTPVVEPDGGANGAVAVIRDETRLYDLEQTLGQRDHFQGIIGRAPAMQKLYAMIDALADIQTTVLINGESGTGKELVAAALHDRGSAKERPFVKVNSSSLSEHLLESELFGHVRGAFTGAIANKIGRFQKADGGTIFLDEIGDISPAMQMRLLRVLQEREFERVGDSTTIKVDVRVIAATNQDLAERVRQGTFRQDLYYRLNVVRLTPPPLRERMDDLPLLIDHFLNIFNARFGKEIKSVSNEVTALLQRHSWPGNVRELEHLLEHACILCRAEVIEMEHIPQDIIDSVDSSPEYADFTASESVVPLSLQDALEKAGGNKAQAARLLGVSRRTIYRQLP